MTLREPTADPARLRAALAPKLAELPAPALKLRLEIVGARRAHRRAARARRARRETCCRDGSGKACARCGQPSAQAGSRRWWRSLRGRASRKRARCSFRATTERTAAGARRGARRRHAAPRQQAGGRRRARGVARRRPLVDGGAGRTAATSTSCSRRARTPSSTATTTQARGSPSAPKRRSRCGGSTSSKPASGAWKLSTRARPEPALRNPCRTPGGATMKRARAGDDDLARRR